MKTKSLLKVKGFDFSPNFQGFSYLTHLIGSESNLEYIGLAKNQLGSWADVESLFGQIGRFPLTQQQVEEYRLKEKERDAIIQKNLKAKIAYH